MELNSLVWVVAILVYVRHSMNINFPCKCGHPKRDHVKDHVTYKNNWVPKGYCFTCSWNCINLMPCHVCVSFVPDNLRYLESLVGKE